MTVLEHPRIEPDRLWIRAALIVMAVICILASLVVDIVLFDRTFLKEGPPDWQTSGMIRMGFSLMAGVAVALAFAPETLPARTMQLHPNRLRLVFAAICVATYGIHLWAAYALLFNRQSLMDEVEEVGLVALAQEAAIAVALVFLLLTAMRGKGLDAVRLLSIPGRWIASAMVLAVLLLLLEETSYGQHYFGWSTPAVFEGNLQMETNLHNFYTIRFEMVYYGVAFLAFVALPVLRDGAPDWLRKPLLRFVPPADFALLAMPLVAGMYASWNIMPQQVMFFSGTLIYLIMLWRWGMFSSMASLGLVTIISTQILYLVFGANQIRLYEVAEIREASICFALLAYSVWFWHTNRETPSQDKPA
ncbi:hypothetical protein [uncultured Hoeflea sp.]|uniref:hypothetical protein n=1 Tax=uncultured Hoeflea sp. TaxID=538666 RepID=UPI00262A2D54|nr:hypothetical protein [uncultured Hoeflea sp.]